MWLLPSQDPEKLHRFFMWCRDTGINNPGIVLVEKNHFGSLETEYKALIAPPGWTFHLTESGEFVGQIREVWDLYKDLPWMGIMGDDCLTLSIQWEKMLLESLVGWNVVSVHDDRKAGSGGIGRGSIWSGDLVRTIGTLFFKGFNEDEQYEAWENLTGATAAKTHRADIVVRRPLHISTHAYGGENIQEWLDNDAQALAQKIEDLKKERGIIKWDVDYTGVKIMVAVPTGDGKFEYEFLGCLHETFAMLTHAGIPHEFVVEPFNADICMARNKLFAKFMRSDSTHCLMIDDDMGWTPQAVGRLFAAKKDFVAVAGPKKREPLQCATTPLPLDKNFGKITFEPDSGTVEVLEVGGAFNLYTKEFGNKMIEAYPELAYMGIGGEEEYSLFLPLITEKAYKAEDYALCNRWRKIGGKVYVCPDISLKHTGRKVFEGAWSDTWPKQNPMKEAAE